MDGKDEVSVNGDTNFYEIAAEELSDAARAAGEMKQAKLKEKAEREESSYYAEEEDEDENETSKEFAEIPLSEQA